MPRNSKTVPLAQFLAEENARPEPEPGQVWWAVCSIREAVLDVVKDRSALPMSSTMLSERRKLYFGGSDKKARPCIIMEVDEARAQVTVVPMGTFGGIPIEKMDLHTARLSISVGSTPAWPQHDSHVLRITPSWPGSRDKACYAISHEVTIPFSSLGNIYTWPVAPKRPQSGEPGRVLMPAARALRALATMLPVPLRAVDADVPIGLFTVDPDEMDILGDIIDKRERLLSSKTAEEIREMNATYDAQLERAHNARQAQGERR